MKILDKNTFLIRLALVCLGLTALIVLLNYSIDIFGLFRGKKDRLIYVNERTSKYLFSYRYVPENFDGFIIGPSLSDNLNPEKLKGFKIYNASSMGANISDLNYLANNFLEKGKMKVAIICLDPYLTKEFGKKSATIDPKEYWGALGSTNLFKTYLFAIARNLGLTKPKYNTVGWHNYELDMAEINSEKAIKEKLKTRSAETPATNPQADQELKETLQRFRENNIKVIAYFTPVPYELYHLQYDGYRKYTQYTSSYFTKDDILMDLNDEKYKSYTKDYATYIDHGHLSAKGQQFVLSKIQEALDSIHKKPTQ